MTETSRSMHLLEAAFAENGVEVQIRQDSRTEAKQFELGLISITKGLFKLDAYSDDEGMVSSVFDGDYEGLSDGSMSGNETEVEQDYQAQRASGEFIETSASLEGNAKAGKTESSLPDIVLGGSVSDKSIAEVKPFSEHGINTEREKTSWNEGTSGSNSSKAFGGQVPDGLANSAKRGKDNSRDNGKGDNNLDGEGPGSNQPSDVLSERYLRDELTTYEAFSLQPTDSETKRSTKINEITTRVKVGRWHEVLINKEEIPREAIRNSIIQLHKKEPVTSKMRKLFPNQHSQLTHLLEGKVGMERDWRFEWSIASLNQEFSRVDPKTGKKRTNKITLYLRRSPKRNLDYGELLRHYQELRNRHRYAAMQLQMQWHRSMQAQQQRQYAMQAEVQLQMQRQPRSSRIPRPAIKSGERVPNEL